jgi:phenylalanyl-tRNA synthetase alpha chain
MDTLELAKKLHPLERKVLPHIKPGITLDELAKKSALQEIEAMRAVQWLENKEAVSVKSEEKEIIELDKNGKRYKSGGLPEKRFLLAVLEKELSLDAVGKKSGLDTNELSISMGFLKKKDAITIRKDKEIIVSITETGKTLLKKESSEEKFLEKEFPVAFSDLSSADKLTFEELLKRKEIVKKTKRVFREISLTSLGETLSKQKISDLEIVDRVNSKILKDKSWKGKEFRSYDVEINVPRITGGKRHFENQVVEYIKSIWLELGFSEMTGEISHTSFWDLDALFVPQDHPAREMQDTFYIKHPVKGKISQRSLLENIRQTHENGWTTGSQGWQTKWEEERAKENLLRTHTTVLSAQTLAKLKKDDLPAKYFAVGKCFRNETLDWKHLFEFYQVEGIVVDPDANFSNLLGYLKEFFKKMGFPDVRIRPGHFPYTEPSAEVDVWHPVRKQWVELGGSGIFKPEVTKPLMGFEVPVIAWGIGLGRMITEYWGITDIRDLYKNDLKQLRELRMWMK